MFVVNSRCELFCKFKFKDSVEVVYYVGNCCLIDCGNMLGVVFSKLSIMMSIYIKLWNENCVILKFWII